MATFRCAGFEPIEAGNAHLAARIFAECEARERYGEHGMATWIAETGKPGVFRCFIGAYERHGRTTGVTITLTIEGPSEIEQRS